MFDFSDKVIVVTGGAGLIGKQISLAFAEFGGTVVVADVDEEAFRTRLGGRDNVFFQDFDITDPNRIESAMEATIRAFGKIDVCVNCAYPRTEDWGNMIEDVAFESWDRNLKMHLGGYFWTSKTVLEHMKSSKSGNLINLGSIYGVLAPNFNVYGGTGMTTPVAYSAIKGAIVNLSKYLAALYGPYNVRVNCVCPGGVYDNQKEDFLKRYSKLTPLKRMAKDYEIAMPVVFLASPGASYITGQVIMVDGGWSTW